MKRPWTMVFSSMVPDIESLQSVCNIHLVYLGEHLYGELRPLPMTAALPVTPYVMTLPIKKSRLGQRKALDLTNTSVKPVYTGTTEDTSTNDVCLNQSGSETETSKIPDVIRDVATTSSSVSPQTDIVCFNSSGGDTNASGKPAATLTKDSMNTSNACINLLSTETESRNSHEEHMDIAITSPSISADTDLLGYNLPGGDTKTEVNITRMDQIEYETTDSTGSVQEDSKTVSPVTNDAINLQDTAQERQVTLTSMNLVKDVKSLKT